MAMHTSIRVALVSLLLPACNGLEAIDAEDSGSSGNSVPPAVRAAFEGSCGYSGCHAESGPTAPVLAGEAIGNLIGTKYVTIGDVAASEIALQMLPDASLAELGVSRPNPLRMPLTGDYTNNNNYIILAWISGAEFEGGEVATTTEGGEETSGGEETMTGGEAMPTMTNVQADIFDKLCGCHAGGQGGLTLPIGDKDASHAALINIKAIGDPTKTLVVPGDSANSYLWQKCAGSDGIKGDPMPLGSGTLQDPELQLLADWIDAGAMND